MNGLRRQFSAFRTRSPAGSADQDARAAREAEERYRAHDEYFGAPFYKSIRFRLTAWYATALILVILALAISLHTLLIRALTNDAESRLGNAATEVVKSVNVLVNQTGPRSPGGCGQQFEVRPPDADADAIVLSGLWFQVYDCERNPVYVESSGALSEPPQDLEAAIGDRDIFQVDQNTFKTVRVGNADALIIVAPFYPETGAPAPTAGWIVVGEAIGSRDTIINVVDQILRLFGVVGVGLAVWGGWLMAGRALAPVGRITRMADSIANSDGTVSLSRRIEVPKTGDELSRLAHTFNVMLDRIETAFNTQRRFVSDASHELRTPLTSVRGNVDVLLRHLKSDRPLEKGDVIEELSVVQRESARMSRLIEDMLALARTDASNQGELLKPQPVSLEVLAHEAFRTAHQLTQGQELKLEILDPVTINADGDRLVQIMIILLDNAIRHTAPDGTVTLTVGRVNDVVDHEACAMVRVTDTGTGIATEHLPHLFERFYRAEDARSRASGGTGLGLSIALTIVRGHHGWIDVETSVGEGTMFTVWIPLKANAEATVADDPERTRLTEPGLIGKIQSWREGRSVHPDAEPHPASEKTVGAGDT